MKTTYSSAFPVRIIAAFLLFASAAALIATSMMSPKLPWATPVISVGTAPTSAEVDLATNTIYVPNPGDNTISVVDGRRCNATDFSRCKPVATMTDVGFAPTWLTLDSTTHTLYVTDSADENGDPGHQIAVLNVANCNARKTSGCAQGALALVTVGATGNDLDFAFTALDSSLHTLYVGDVDFEPLSMINTATCNALQTSGCGSVLTTTVTGLNPAIDPSNHSVYVGNLAEGSLYVFNGATCNADDQSDCSFVSVAQLPADYLPYQAVIDPATHSIYLPLFGEDVLGYTGVIDGSTCNGIDRSGCGQTPQLIQVGSGPFVARLDASTSTVYVSNGGSSSLSVIDAANCNGLNPSGCPKTVPAVAVGGSPGFAINSNTHTIYSASQDTDVVWVLDASDCNGQNSQDCTKFAPATMTGAGTQAFADNPDTHTLYVSNQLDGSVSLIDTAACNRSHLAACNRRWPKFNVNYLPRFFAINRSTNTIYLGLWGTNKLAVINGATCNSGTTAGCSSYRAHESGISRNSWLWMKPPTLSMSSIKATAIRRVPCRSSTGVSVMARTLRVAVNPGLPPS